MHPVNLNTYRDTCVHIPVIHGTAKNRKVHYLRQTHGVPDFIKNLDAPAFIDGIVNLNENDLHLRNQERLAANRQRIAASQQRILDYLLANEAQHVLVEGKAAENDSARMNEKSSTRDLYHAERIFKNYAAKSTLTPEQECFFEEYGASAAYVYLAKQPVRLVGLECIALNSRGYDSALLRNTIFRKLNLLRILDSIKQLEQMYASDLGCALRILIWTKNAYLPSGIGSYVRKRIIVIKQKLRTTVIRRKSILIALRDTPFETQSARVNVGAEIAIAASVLNKYEDHYRAYTIAEREKFALREFAKYSRTYRDEDIYFIFGAGHEFTGRLGDISGNTVEDPFARRILDPRESSERRN